MEETYRNIDIGFVAVRMSVMAKTIQEDFLYKKAYEFSYAAFRVASSAKNRNIAELLESRAALLLDSVSIADYDKTRDALNSIVNLAGLLADAGILYPANREVLAREAESIELAIKALPKKGTLPDLNLGKIFSKSPLPIKRQNMNQSAKTPNQSEIKSSAVEIADKGNSADEIADKDYDEISSIKSEMRQSAIVDKLQQSENVPGGQAGCRLNDLQSLFPDVSERTLRYDLESLMLRGLVERMGSRRNSIYRIKGRQESVIELTGPLLHDHNPGV